MSNENDELPVAAWLRADGQPSISTMAYAITSAVRDLWLRVNPANVERYTLPCVLLSDAQRIREERDRLRAESATLRRMLARSAGGPGLYTDDGELQDNSTIPFIDFRRDSIGMIADKFAERSRLAGEKT